MSENRNSDAAIGALVVAGLLAGVGYGTYRVLKVFGFFSKGQKVTREQLLEQESIAQQREIATLQRQVDESKAEAKRQQIIAEVKLAETRGQDVCWGCKTIEPERCDQGHCQNCSGHCPCCGMCGECTGYGNSECNACYD